MFFSQALGQRHDFSHRLFEWANFRELRADVHLHTAKVQVLQLGRPLVHALDFLEGDPEFVIVSAGGDLGVCLGVDVRVHPHRDRRFLFQATGDLVDASQLRLALGVERVDALLQREFDFLLRFADPGENAF